MKKLNIRNERVKVTARFYEEGSVLQGTKRGSCKGFEIVLSMESDEPREQIAQLIRLSHRMCFTEAALSGAIALNMQHVLNGQSIEVVTDRF